MRWRDARPGSLDVGNLFGAFCSVMIVNSTKDENINQQTKPAASHVDS